MVQEANTKQEEQIDDKRVVLSLFAPRQNRVSLVASWNNWEPQPMQRDEKGVWRIEVPLDDGEYAYQFEVEAQDGDSAESDDGNEHRIRVADPWSLRITKDGKSSLTVRDGRRVDLSYDWQHDDTPLPPNHKLILYEMHVGDFSGGPGDEKEDGRSGTLQDVIDKLDYLVELGINAIELMPVNAFGPAYDWGYSQLSYFAIESSYGSPNDFCRMVDECHARGIRVLYDAVYNHMSPDAPLHRIGPDYWFYAENPDEEMLQFGPKLNYFYTDEELGVWPARDYAFDAMRFWMKAYHLDGIRFDATRALADFDLLHEFNNEMHNCADIRPLIGIAEHVPEDPAVTGTDGPMDAAWRNSMGKQLMAALTGEEKAGQPPHDTGALLAGLDARQEGYASTLNAVIFFDNHDQDSIFWQLQQTGLPDEAIFRRVKLGAGLLLTAPGIPLLWMGQEFGRVAPRGESDQPKPLDWSLLERPENRDLMQHHARLIQIRKETPALTGDTFEVVANLPEAEIIAYKRWDEDGSVVIVIANLKDEGADGVRLESEAIDNGRWRDLLNEEDINVEENALTIALAASEVKVLVKSS